MSDGILFPVPTITATLPQRIAPPLGKAGAALVYRIAEDEWRQTEFLSLAWQSAIERELNLVRAVPHPEGEPAAFSRMHLRNMKGLWGIQLEQIEQSLGLRGDSWRRLGFIGGVGIVANSFAVPFGDCLLYGQQQKGLTETLCLRPGFFPDTTTDAARLADFVGAHNCALIDWCSASLLLPFTDAFTQYFSTETP